LCKKIACHSLNTGKPNLTHWNSWRIHQLKLHIYRNEFHETNYYTVLLFIYKSGQLKEKTHASNKQVDFNSENKESNKTIMQRTDNNGLHLNAILMMPRKIWRPQITSPQESVSCKLTSPWWSSPLDQPAQHISKS
jgi:hypothetical protein